MFLSSKNLKVQNNLLKETQSQEIISKNEIKLLSNFFKDQPEAQEILHRLANSSGEIQILLSLISKIYQSVSEPEFADSREYIAWLERRGEYWW